MNRNLVVACACLAAAWPWAARADVVLDWSATLRKVVQDDGILNAPPLANPGWSTRTMAMTSGAIYDAFQAVNRTHRPFLSNRFDGTASADAAAAQAAYDLILDCYPLQQATLATALSASLNSVSNIDARNKGIALGHQIAQDYMLARTGDGSAPNLITWPEGTLPGEWRSPDPAHPQTAWGPTWGAVKPFTYANTGQFPTVSGPPGLNTAAYTQAFNQVKEWGALNSPSRIAEDTDGDSFDPTKIGIFWAYDRPAMGPPPVLFLRNLEEIAAAAGAPPAENARLFALANIAEADAATAAWDLKFDRNFWRPISAIQFGGTGGPGETGGDGNGDTVGDLNWNPLGAPGNDPLSLTDDFTPPFPAYTSGHATMGGAIFKAIELFYGDNNFLAADQKYAGDPESSSYTLSSQEAGAGGPRSYVRFTQQGLLDIGTENSPEGENGMSRIYLGIHWIFDQRDGITLGNDVAQHVYANYFQPVPESSAIVLCAVALLAAGSTARRRE